MILKHLLQVDTFLVTVGCLHNLLTLGMSRQAVDAHSSHICAKYRHSQWVSQLQWQLQHPPVNSQRVQHTPHCRVLNSQGVTVATTKTLLVSL